MIVQGVTSSGLAKPVLVDASGKVYVVASEPSVLNPVGVLSQLVNLNLPAGQSTQVIFTIPASQRHRLTMFNIAYIGTVAGVALVPYVNGSGIQLSFASQVAIVSGTNYVYMVDVLMEAGWALECAVIGATLNDDFIGRCATQRVL